VICFLFFFIVVCFFDFDLHVFCGDAGVLFFFFFLFCCFWFSF